MANEMKTLTIGSDTFTVVDGEAVHCCAQDLTEEQKAQARANIGAAAAYDPIVFTTEDNGESINCNKTFDEAMAMFDNMQTEALYLMDVPEYNACAMARNIGATLLDGVLMYSFVQNASEITAILLTPAGAMMAVQE